MGKALLVQNFSNTLGKENEPHCSSHTLRLDKKSRPEISQRAIVYENEL